MAAVHMAQTQSQKLATLKPKEVQAGKAPDDEQGKAQARVSERATLDPARATLRLDLRTKPSGAERASTQPEPTRGALERELDRVQSAVQAHEATFGQQLIWLVLSQALFLNAYLMVLVFGSGPMIPGRRWLLAGLAIFSGGFAVFAYIALRCSRDAGQALRATRRELEAALVKFGRAPVFAPPSAVSAGLASFAAGLLPHMVIAGWLVISIYALAAPNHPPASLENQSSNVVGQQEDGAGNTEAASRAPSTARAKHRTQSETSRQQSNQRTGFKW